MISASSTQRRRASTSSVDSSERASWIGSAALERHGQHAHVVAVELGVGELGPFDVRRADLDVVGRAAQARRERREAGRRSLEAAPPAAEPAEPEVDPLDEPALRAQLLVDLGAQLAAHDRVRDRRGQQHGDSHRQRGGHRHAPPQRHQASLST